MFWRSDLRLWLSNPGDGHHKLCHRLLQTAVWLCGGLVQLCTSGDECHPIFLCIYFRGKGWICVGVWDFRVGTYSNFGTSCAFSLLWGESSVSYVIAQV